VRADAAGCTHEFLDAVVEMELSFSVSMPIDESVRQTILALSESAWAVALRQDGSEREGAWVAELQGLDLSAWPAGSRAICRRERPHPGAQLTFTDHEGHRFQVLLTNQAGDPVTLEARHRARAGVEDAIRAAKDTGLRNLPFREFAPNAAWLELVLMAQDLLCWAQRLLLEGDLARAEPKRLRYRLLHVAGRITRSGRRLRLHLPEAWPWAGALAAAFGRLDALPAPG
jgi:DDE family transposase